MTAVPRQVSGLVLDAATGAPVAGGVQVTVLGADGQPSSAAQDSSGKISNAFVANGGVVTFQVDRDAAVPFDLVVVLRAAGYDAGSARVQVVGNGVVTFTTRLASHANPPAGVDSAVVEAAGSADQSGTLVDDVVIATAPTEATKGATVQLAVPADTVITSASGEPLSGELRATASYYAPSADTALAAFPGGLDVLVPANQGGASAGTFQSAGFTAVEITDASGNVASSFSQPFSLTVKVPATTIHPEKGVPVRAGDTIPFWSYDEATGLWQSEGEVTLVASGDPAILTGVAAVNHMSYFNLDWYSDRCASAQPITITGNPNNVALTLKLRGTSGGYYRELYASGPNMSPVTLKNAPTFALDIEAWANGQKIGEVKGARVCSAAATLPVQVPTNMSPAALEVIVSRVCDGETKRSALGSATVVVSPANLVGVTGNNGSARFEGLVAGGTATVSAWALDGTRLPTQKVTLVAGANVVQLVQPVICQLTGATGAAGD